MSDTESKTEDHETGFSGLPTGLPAGRQGRPVYELSYLLLPSIPEENLAEVVTKIEKTIEEKGGQKIDSEAPFLHELAYEMSKVVGASRYLVKNAYIGWIKFDLPVGETGPPVAEDLDLPIDEAGAHPVEEIKSLVEQMEEVLRSLLVKAERETRFTFASTLEPEEEEGAENTEENGSKKENTDPAGKSEIVVK